MCCVYSVFESIESLGQGWVRFGCFQVKHHFTLQAHERNPWCTWWRLEQYDFSNNLWAVTNDLRICSIMIPFSRGWCWFCEAQWVHFSLKVLILFILLFLFFFFFLLLAPGAWIALLIHSVSVSYCLYCISAALSSFLIPPSLSLSLPLCLSVCLSLSLSLSLSLGSLSDLSLSLSL